MSFGLIFLFQSEDLIKDVCIFEKSKDKII